MRSWLIAAVTLLSVTPGCGGSSNSNGSDGGSSAVDSGAVDAAAVDSGAVDSGAVSHDAGAIDSASHDAGHDGGSASTNCGRLATCCPRIATNPEFHDGCVAALASGSDAQCAASLAQDCCAGLTTCCTTLPDSTRLLCQEVVSSNDGMICQDNLATYCTP